MAKKTKRQVEKIVTAKANGKQPLKSVKTDDSKLGEGDLDTRTTKMYDWIKS
mgnify:CR=1 FL=1